MINRDAILKAAGAFDLEDLSMPALASELGVSRAAINRYFPRKQDLVDALVKQRSQAIVVPPRDGGPWQEWMLSAADAIREFIAATERPGGFAPADSATHPLVEAVMDTLFSAGYSAREAWDLYLLVCAIAAGSVAHKRRLATYGPYTRKYLRDQLTQAGVNNGSPLLKLVEPVAAMEPDTWFREQIGMAIRAYEPRLTARESGHSPGQGGDE